MKTRILQFAGKYVPESYQTKLGGVGLILLAIAGVINLIWEGSVPGLPPMSLDQIITTGGLGFVGIGLGRKVDRNTEAVKASASK